MSQEMTGTHEIDRSTLVAGGVYAMMLLLLVAWAAGIGR